MTMNHARKMLGLCANGAQRGGGKAAHLVPEGSSKAVCGARPGRTSAGWSDPLEYKELARVCPKCLRALRDGADMSANIRLTHLQRLTLRDACSPEGSRMPLWQRESQKRTHWRRAIEKMERLGLVTRVQDTNVWVATEAGRAVNDRGE
jgi:hypothetical protein